MMNPSGSASREFRSCRGSEIVGSWESSVEVRPSHATGTTGGATWSGGWPAGGRSACRHGSTCPVRTPPRAAWARWISSSGGLVAGLADAGGVLVKPCKDLLDHRELPFLQRLAPRAVHGHELHPHL